MTDRLPADWAPQVARRQDGVFTRRQALAEGATPAQVRRRVANGRWLRVVGDGFVLAGTMVTARRRVTSAALTWPDAVVCLRAAAQLHGYPVDDGAEVDVIVPARRTGRRGLITHELRLEAAEIVRRGNARVTSPRRTLFDCLGRLPGPESDALAAWAIARGLLDRYDLAQDLGRRPRWWGNARRRQAVADHRDGAIGPAERRLHRLLRRAGIAGWTGNAPIFDHGRIVARADVLFAAAGLVIEVDGEAYHGRGRFQADRTRQNALVAAGYTVLRFTWSDLVDRPDQVLHQIRTVLAARTSPRPRSRPLP